MNPKFSTQRIVYALAILLLIVITCKRQGQDRPSDVAANEQLDTLASFTVSIADDWNQLFYRKEGWFGADGIFAIPLDGVDTPAAGMDTSTLLYFSDTMTGEVIGEDSVRNFKMVNNSVAYVHSLYPTPDDIDILLNRDEQGNPQNYFTPNTANSESREYYWTGDGFVNQEKDRTLYIFGYRVIDHSEASWAFEIVGSTMIAIPDPLSPPFENHRQFDTPLFFKKDSMRTGMFGSGVFVNTKAAGAPDPDGYVYVYGLFNETKELLVARVKPRDFEDFSSWRYWDGEQWNRDILTAAVLTDRISNELSLTPMADGRYLLVFQSDGIGQHTAIRIAESPVGPFGPLQKIWRAPEVEEAPGLIPYNAKAHYSLSTRDELLISYNTISMDYFKDILTHPHMYRPRFIRLKID